MINCISGVVKDGVVVPSLPLPEGANVEIHWKEAHREEQKVDEPAAARLSPAELRKLPRQQRQAILEAAAALAEHDYQADRELTGFEAYSEELDDDDESGSA